MKDFLKYIWEMVVAFGVLVATIWVLLTDEEQQRQLEYDQGGGERE